MQLASTKPCNYCGLPTEEVYCCHACQILDQHVKGLWQSSGENSFAHLDETKFRDLYKQTQSHKFDYVFYAEGLHCSSCVHLLEKLPEFSSDVVEARVHFGNSTVSICLREGGSLARVAQVISELGYTPSLLAEGENTSDKYKKENRTFLKRIAVAGFCAGNIMLFVVPVYAGLAGSWAQAFNWISFFLFLPILFYSARPFYQGALNALKYHTVNVDLPIAIAMLSGFFLSLCNLVRGDGAVYFDSTASFLFFILSARYLLKRVQQNYLAPSRAQSFFKSEKYLRQNGDSTEFVPWSEVCPGDRLLVKRGQILPCDGNLASVHALLDMSLFNGEALPKRFARDMEVFAGTKVLEDDIQVIAASSLQDSRMGHLFKQLDAGSEVKNDFTTLTDKLAQKLIITVFAVAIVFFAAYSFVNLSEAFNRALALIVLACPCALAFGTPLTYGLALKNSQRKGILLKDSKTLEKVLEIKNIFFDKTGTLTEGELSLMPSSSDFSKEMKQIILAIEAQSYHPVAFALRKAWSGVEALPAFTSREEILGKGVRGEYQGAHYEITHLSESTHDSEIAVQVLKDGETLGRLYFEDAVRKDSAQVVHTLQKRGIQCFILSGDKKIRVLEVARQTGIAKENCHSDLYPEDKKSILIEYKNNCMIGDGANDALSLQAADVGIAVKGSIDLSLQNADVYFTRGGLTPMLELTSLAHCSRRVLVRNLGISLIYNFVGGVLALTGFINPMMAAILMPLSSGLIILSSLWGAR
jgi:ATPase, P-type (transporting), HAD superfamily, subfamily IC/heavy metal translocating P-type ATPase